MFLNMFLPTYVTVKSQRKTFDWYWWWPRKPIQWKQSHFPSEKRLSKIVFEYSVCVLCMFTACVWVFCFSSTVLLIFKYLCRPLWGENVFQWIAEVGWLVAMFLKSWKKVDQKRSFYENVKLRHSKAICH